MDYDELVIKVVDLLQRETRVPYRVLKLRFNIDDDYIEGLKDGLIYAKKLAQDEENRILVWTGAAGEASSSTPKYSTDAGRSMGSSDAVLGGFCASSANNRALNWLRTMPCPITSPLSQYSPKVQRSQHGRMAHGRGVARLDKQAGRPAVMG